MKQAKLIFLILLIGSLIGGFIFRSPIFIVFFVLNFIILFTLRKKELQHLFTKEAQQAKETLLKDFPYADVNRYVQKTKEIFFQVMKQIEHQQFPSLYGYGTKGIEDTLDSAKQRYFKQIRHPMDSFKNLTIKKIDITKYYKNDNHSFFKVSLLVQYENTRRDEPEVLEHLYSYTWVYDKNSEKWYIAGMQIPSFTITDPTLPLGKLPFFE